MHTKYPDTDGRIRFAKVGEHERMRGNALYWAPTPPLSFRVEFVESIFESGGMKGAVRSSSGMALTMLTLPTGGLHAGGGPVQGA